MLHIQSRCAALAGFEDIGIGSHDAQLPALRSYFFAGQAGVDNSISKPASNTADNTERSRLVRLDRNRGCDSQRRIALIVTFIYMHSTDVAIDLHGIRRNCRANIWL